jgi:hypothetical protein
VYRAVHYQPAPRTKEGFCSVTSGLTFPTPEDAEAEYDRLMGELSPRPTGGYIEKHVPAFGWLLYSPLQGE